MGFWNSVITGAVSAAVNARPPAGAVRVYQLCRELGWSVEERHDSGVVLHFKCPTFGVRKLLVCWGDHALTVTGFSSFSKRPNDIPRDLPGYLLTRNRELLAASWRLHADGEGVATLAVNYTGALDMTAAYFRTVCAEVVEEVNTFDAGMRKAGML